MSVARGVIAIAIVGIAFAALAQAGKFPMSGTSEGAKANVGEPAAPGAAPSRPDVDESALRYFASQGDTRRVDAEIARLRALYPDWTPPANLSSLLGSGTASDPELDHLWDLYTQNRIGEARAAITARQASDPQWKPPQDLANALDAAEARTRLVNASDNAQWQTVLSVATDEPSLLTCANVDLLWRVAEAFAKTDQAGRTRDVYGYILTNCSNPAERLATLQKALGLLPDEQVADLLKFERKNGDKPDDFSSIRDELARRRVAKASTDPKIIASADDLAVVERLAANETTPGTLVILGFYDYRHGQPEKALERFKTALDREGGPKAAEGYALTLLSLKRFVDAEAFAADWRDKSADNMRTYLDAATALLSQDPPVKLEPKVIGRIFPAVVKERDVDGAQALGWYSYNTGQFRSALEWFEEALGWKADDEPSAYGVALASQRLDDRARFNAIVARWRARSERIADLADGTAKLRAAASPVAPAAVEPPVRRSAETAVETRRTEGSRTEEARMAAYTRVVARQESTMVRPPASAGAGRRNCVMTRNPSSLSAGAALSLGWCLMELNRPLEAATAFDQAVRLGNATTREEAAYGKSLAYLRKNLTAQASVAAAEAPQTSTRRTELAAAILAQRAVAAYRDGRWVEVILALGERARIVPEQNDLMLLRAWSYFKLGRYPDAGRLFRAIQGTGYSEDAAAGLNAIQEVTGMIRY